MLIVPPEQMQAMRSHAAGRYPEECVGALMGDWNFAAGVRTVAEVVPLANAAEHPLRTFRIDPADMLALLRRERETGRTLVGFFHSHPDCPARPSETDRRQGVPDYSFVIISVVGGVPTDTTSWVFDSATERFAPEGVVVLGISTTPN